MFDWLIHNDRNATCVRILDLRNYSRSTSYGAVKHWLSYNLLLSQFLCPKLSFLANDVADINFLILMCMETFTVLLLISLVLFILSPIVFVLNNINPQSIIVYEDIKGKEKFRNFVQANIATSTILHIPIIFERFFWVLNPQGLQYMIHF